MIDCRCVRGRVSGAEVTAHLTGEEMIAQMMGREISVLITREGVAAVMRSTSTITASMTHVCEVGREDFLAVSPEMLWLVPGNNFEGVFEVLANVEWKIE